MTKKCIPRYSSAHCHCQSCILDLETLPKSSKLCRCSVVGIGSRAFSLASPSGRYARQQHHHECILHINEHAREEPDRHKSLDSDRKSWEGQWVPRREGTQEQGRRFEKRRRQHDVHHGFFDDSEDHGDLLCCSAGDCNTIFGDVRDFCALPTTQRASPEAANIPIPSKPTTNSLIRISEGALSSTVQAKPISKA